MKKLITIVIFLLSISIYAQDYSSISATISPLSDMEQKGLTSTLEFEYSSQILYVKIGTTLISGIDPIYTDIHGGFGYNNYSGMYDNTRIFVGIILGRSTREGMSYGEVFGVETGFEVKVLERLYLGGTLMYRIRNDESHLQRTDLNGNTYVNKDFWQLNAGFKVRINIGAN